MNNFSQISGEYKKGFIDDVLNGMSLLLDNVQLKQFKQNVFDLIDKNIKETKELFEDGRIDLISYNSAMIILIGLKEELKGDGE